MTTSPVPASSGTDEPAEKERPPVTAPRATVRIPGSTYRVQLTKDFTFRDARELVDYWQTLGITDVYAAPFLKARPGSVHGYDVVDPGVLNPEIGGEEDLRQLHEALAAREMGLLMDVVPNHMCVNTNDNAWWNNVLENGPSSPFARYFDIDWSPPKAELQDKVLLPLLGNQYGKVLEAGELRLSEADGALWVTYFERRFPIGPGTYPLVLDGVLARLRARVSSGDVGDVRLAELIEAARALPLRSETAPEKVRQRQNDKETLKAGRRDEELQAINGTPGDSRSFDRLEELLARQAYRLGYWRVAAEQINYRRFFEINDLAAIRIEESEVLDAVHARSFDLLRRGWITGLRVDHVDGLREPRRYLDELAARTDVAYVVVEKILASDERLPRPWATEGTTGYEFLNILNGLFVARAGERPLRALYDGLRTVPGAFEDIVYESKSLILTAAMSSELAVLTRRLGRISEQHRWSRDFTTGALQQVLAATIAGFPVYRTYIAAGETEVTPQDILHIRGAIARARRRNASVDPSTFEFLADVLLMRDPDGLSEAQRADRRDFVLRFQQLTGPVMAKGLEDTAFYRYFPLLSLNEVGGAPDRFGVQVDEFHRLMEERARERPGALSATSTHDTKRGEDARARLNVLSEIPEVWSAAVGEWRELATRLKPRIDGVPCPDVDDEYYIYQTLVGALPPEPLDDDAVAAFAPRVQGAIEKAMREAKRNTSWISPNAAYEEATRTFVARLLERSGPFFPRLAALVERVVRPGMLNSLAQLVLKLTAPGVPDFFQGTELWDLSMVDPDNRRAVDFGERRRALEEMVQPRPVGVSDGVAGQGAANGNLIRELWASAADGRIKLYLTRALLGCRGAERELFARGAYLALQIEGPRRDNVVAFARLWQRRVVITIVGRFFTQLDLDAGGAPSGGWGETRLRLPDLLPLGALTDVLSGSQVTVSSDTLPLADAFATLPFAVLVGDVQMRR